MASLVAVAALPQHLRPQDAWEREITDVAFGRRGGSAPHLNPRRCVRAPSDREPLEVRAAALAAERARLADAIARVPAAAPARATLVAALAEADRRLSFLAGWDESLAAAERDYRAAVASAAVASAARRDCEDPSEAPRLAAALEVAQAEVRLAWRAGLALLDGWRSTAGEVCPALRLAAERRDRIAGALEAVGPAAREHRADPLAVAVDPLAAPAALGKLLAGAAP